MKRLLMPLRRGVLMVGILMGTGVAVSAPRQDAIALRIARQQYNLVMTGDEVTGQDFQVSRTPGALRGRNHVGVVDLQLKKGDVSGTLAGSMVNLKVTQEGDTLSAKGGFGGRPATVKMSPDYLEIYLRNCTYRLNAREPGRSYAGRRSCDRASVPESEIWLPDEFLAASPEERAALLLLAI
ncbi:hypothetical protein LZ198_09280 [Myxococcus sp. K15C18031901]|uniref:hypothetical protein n=1 Tax=Myxococcus dinghuensis TaxID=2906761 RepID=UPI0020A70CE5|nr:hypothetical protein [Myxococcus dinghuensis]MCP3099060.1 hypothetical protein [Myxococcus dinghuensis]